MLQMCQRNPHFLKGKGSSCHRVVTSIISEALLVNNNEQENGQSYSMHEWWGSPFARECHLQNGHLALLQMNDFNSSYVDRGCSPLIYFQWKMIRVLGAFPVGSRIPQEYVCSSLHNQSSTGTTPLAHTFPHKTSSLSSAFLPCCQQASTHVAWRRN